MVEFMARKPLSNQMQTDNRPEQSGEKDDPQPTGLVLFWGDTEK
jgi:hypothetical protein